MDERNQPEEIESLEDLPEEERERVRSMLSRLMELGIGAVYGQEEGEEEEEPDRLYEPVDCAERVEVCRSVCCTFQFALTKKEAEEGQIEYNRERPFFIKREADGYCPHMDRETFACTVWENRPLRCRKYDCRTDPEVWQDVERMVLRPGLSAVRKQDVSGQE